MRHLAAAEHDAELDLVSLGKKLPCVARLEVDIVRVRSWMKTHLLQLLLMLVLPLILLALLLLVPEFSVINDLADGRVCLWSDLDKVEFPLHGQLKGLARGHDSELLTLFVDDAQLGGADIAINSGARLTWRTLWLFPDYCSAPEMCDADPPGRRIEQNSPQSYGIRAFQQSDNRSLHLPMTESNHVSLLAPAKINLGLEVLRRRPDGYHDLNTLFVALDFGDQVDVSRRNDNRILCQVEGADDIPTDGRNLAVAALLRLREELGLTGGFDIHLTKRIPTGGGLGGGSSDAAAALRGAQALAGSGRPDDALLHRIARDLGADVPFFLHGGTALGQGIGNDINPVHLPFPWAVLLVNPGIHVPTPWAYRELGREEERRPASDLVGALRLGIGQPEQLSRTIVNDFEGVVFGRYPILRRIKEELVDAGALFALMSGSGATIFGLFETVESARQAQGRFADTWSAVGTLVRS